MVRIVYRNPLELWGEPSYNEPWILIPAGIGGPLVIANDPALIRHVLVDNSAGYKMAKVRQLLLRPILRDGLLTAEGPGWKRSRKAMAPVFTPRHIAGFARPMLERSIEFARRYDGVSETDIARDMTAITYDILAETLFSGEIAGEPGAFASQIDRLFETMGRVDPLDLLRAPDWLPRLTRLRGRRTMSYFRRIVADTITLTEIPAPPFKEQKRAEAYMAMLKAHGLTDVEMDAEGNVMGLRRGSGPAGGPLVVLAAHLDTVFPEGTDVKVRREGTKR